MKRVIVLLFLIIGLSTVAHGQCTTSANVLFQIPVVGTQTGWGTCLNTDLTMLDTLLGGAPVLTNNSTTPSVSNGATFRTNSSSTTAITNFTNGFSGQRILIICNDANTSLTSGSNLALATSFSCTSSTSGSIEFVLIGSVWTEVNRTTLSINRRSCDIAIGDESASSAIANAQLGPQSRLCYIPAQATVTEVDVAADGGTPNVIMARNHAGTIANLVSGALATAASGGIACTNTGGTTGIDGATSCTNTLQNTSLAVGDYLELVSGTAGGTAKLMTVHIIYTVTN